MSGLPEVAPLERPVVDWERHRGHGSPKILPPPGEVWRNPATNRKVGHRYYTRVTTYADAITESYNLTAWKLRRLLFGASQRRDYVTAAASLTLEDRDRDALDELVGLTLEAAGPSASLLGTALHSLTERLDRGEDLGNPPDEVLPDLAAYTALTQGLIAYVHREARVVCDQLECAGTPDGHAYIAEPCPAGCGPDVLHIIDTKTGSVRYPGKMSTQLAIYAHSDLYNPATAERTPVEVCQKWGAIIHLPVETGEAAPFWLDLEHGWRGAELCGPVRTWHKAKSDEILRPFETVKPVRVVDGEVTRIDPRPASHNPKSPVERPADPSDITDALKVDSERVEVAEVVTHPSGHVEVVGEPRAIGAAPESEDAADVEGADCAHEAWETDSAGQRGRCNDCGTHLGTTDVQRCELLDLSLDPGARQCERVAGHEGACSFASSPTPAERCSVTELRVGECAGACCRPDLAEVGDNGVQPDDGPVEIEVEVLHETVQPMTEAETRELLVEWQPKSHPFEASQWSTGDACVAMILGPDDCGDQCGRPRAHAVHDDPRAGLDIDDESYLDHDPLDIAARVEAGEADSENELLEQLASGPDSDATDEDDEPADGAPPGEAAGVVTDPSDPIADRIRACVTTSELERLGTTAWRSWNAEHRALASMLHDQLAAAEAARKPIAAFEAAVASATSRAELVEIMNAAGGAEWMTADLERLAGDRWAQVPA